MPQPRAPAARASQAKHKPQQHCPRKHKGHYPPGKCRIFFNRGIYHPGQQVNFETGKVFKSHEKVTENLYCHSGKYHKNYGSVKAGSSGRAADSIKLSKNAAVRGLHAGPQGDEERRRPEWPHQGQEVTDSAILRR